MASMEARRSAREEAGAKRLALYVLSDLPHPPRSGNHLRYLQNVNALSQLGFEVVVVAGGVRADASSAGVGTDATIARVVHVPPMAKTPLARARRTVSFVAGAAGIASRDPFGIEFSRRGFDSAVLEVARELRPDLVVLRSLFAHLAQRLRQVAMVVVDVHDASPLMARVLQAEARGLTRAGLILRRRTSERADRWLEHADELWVPSMNEAEYFRSRLPTTSIVLVPNGVDVPTTASVSPPSDELLLVGNFGWPPNLAAAQVLVNQILPAVRTRRPKARVTLVGHGLPREKIAGWREAEVAWEGAVADVAPYFRRAGALVFVPPPWAQTPMPLKVADALSHATPVVLSRGSTGGLPLRSGNEAIIGDDPIKIATELTELLSDAKARDRMARAGHSWARKHVSWEAAWVSIAQESVISRRV
jgi:glycosyltransferase involved in cell wall biosynthesis